MAGAVERLSAIVDAGVRIAAGAEVDLVTLQAWVERRAEYCATVTPQPALDGGDDESLALLLVELAALDRAIVAKIEAQLKTLSGELATTAKLKSYLGQREDALADGWLRCRA